MEPSTVATSGSPAPRMGPGALGRLPIEGLLVVAIIVAAIAAVAILVPGSPLNTPGATSTLAPVAQATASARASAEAATASPTASPEATVRRLFDLKLPSRWKEYPLSEAALRDQINVIRQTNPELASILEFLLDSGAFKAISLYAVGLDGLTPIGTLAVSTFPASGLDLDGMQPLLEATFKQLGATGFRWSHAALPAGDALVVDFEVSVNLATGSPVTVYDRVFHLLADGQVYQLNFTCYPAEVNACLTDATSIARTLVLRGSTI